MDKQCTYFGKTESGIFCQALFGSSGVFEKTAGAPAFADWETGDHLRKYIGGLTKNDRKKNCYALVNALGAGEYFGSNINADWFGWEALAHEGPDYGYKTFEYFGHAFQHHKNKDPSRAFGIPVLSVLNHRMKRVELIIRLDREKARAEGADAIITRIDAGDFPDVSMGCRVPFDVCYICGNKSKTKDDYCIHMRPPEELRHIYGPNKILPDGKKICVKNLTPKFFDISFVFIGADKTAKVMAKLASKGSMVCLGDVCTIPRPSADIAEMVAVSAVLSGPDDLAKTASVDCGCGCGDCSKTAAQKLGEIIKEVPAGPFSMRRLKEMEKTEPDLPDHVLDSVSRHPLSSGLGSLAVMGIVLKPHEFQRVVLKRMGEDELADSCSSSRNVFKSGDSFDDSLKVDTGSSESKDALRDLLPRLAEIIKSRTAFGGAFQVRIAISGSNRNLPLPTPTPIAHSLLNKLSAAYNGYRRELLMKLSQVTEVVESDPQLREIVLGDGLVNMFSKKASVTTTISTDSVAYLMGAYLKDSSLLCNTALAEAIAVSNPSLLSEEHSA